MKTLCAVEKVETSAERKFENNNNFWRGLFRMEGEAQDTEIGENELQKAVDFLLDSKFTLGSLLAP